MASELDGKGASLPYPTPPDPPYHPMRTRFGTPGDPWRPMETHGDPWGPHLGSMGIHGDPRGPMGSPWGPMGIHGGHGGPMGPMGTGLGASASTRNLRPHGPNESSVAALGASLVKKQAHVPVGRNQTISRSWGRAGFSNGSPPRCGGAE